jgi:hypothetical protein
VAACSTQDDDRIGFFLRGLGGHHVKNRDYDGGACRHELIRIDYSNRFSDRV